MSLKFFADKLLEQIKGLEGFSASFDQLVALADILETSVDSLLGRE